MIDALAALFSIFERAEALMLKTGAVVVLAIFGMLALFLGGAWHDGERRASMAFMTLAALCFLALLALTGCASVEGNGFSNSGAYQGVKLCHEKTRHGERWFNCH